jgi:hypothetical protein
VSEKATKKRVLILSDSDDLSRAIALSLDGSVDAVRAGPITAKAGKEQVCRDGFDLIVLGASLPDSEPAAMLYEGVLDERIDDIPLLIVSPRMFFSDPKERIFYSDLPFDRERLRAQVLQIVNG